MKSLLNYLSWLSDYREFMGENPQHKDKKKIVFFIFFLINTAISVFTAIFVSGLVSFLLLGEGMSFIHMFESISFYLIPGIVLFTHLLAVINEISVLIQKLILKTFATS